ncbi:MAG: glucosamine--fructose-6-phosphate aminotransferase (isomerizing) [Parcubacteria group bacterium Gr01-1014_3]|nr:MAG: glucosamine--fructose-6-phosphate aminotransferase (isomerizing) [Parcubacteria group bacterium Gr01-1014_3]
MCGIAGYIGKKEGLPIVLSNLRKLEYRGYDSAGVAFFNSAKDARCEVLKAVGKLANLEKSILGVKSLPLTAVIGHTRWATHGVPNEVNAHPHTDCRGEVILVHNGIIENYRQLKDSLSKKGHRFRSQTDTEVVAHLIEEGLKNGRNFPAALEISLKQIVGAYALAIIYKKDPHKIYLARLGSPLVVGVGKDEHYIASDPTALAGLVKKVIYLKDGQRGVLSVDGFEIGPARPKIESLDLSPEQAQKGKFPHFMLKEIFEGPEVLLSALRGRLMPKTNSVKLGGLSEVESKLKKIKKLEIIACGTSYYSGMVGELFFEELADLPTEVLLASEYRYRRYPVKPGTAALFISQSGETADTLAALRKATANKMLTLGIVNAVGSSIARETIAGVYNHAGPEIGVASTKAFLSQLGVLAQMAIFLSANKAKLHKEVIAELANIPAKINTILKKNEQIKALAQKYIKYQNFIYLGRGHNYPTALEGALKLKEISYVHAEGYAGGEMKHGPIALIDAGFPVIALATKNRVYEKMISNLEEIKARRGPILAIATVGDRHIAKLVDDVFFVPKTHEMLEPLLNIIPLQLFAYHFGVLRGHDVDKPRNLAKSVTVE